MKQEINIRVRLDAKTFWKYCNFDNFRRQRRWFIPLLVGMILITLSVADLTLRPGQSGSVAGLLMGLGLAVPMFCFGLYFIQIQTQVSRQNLKATPEIYSLRLRPEGVYILGLQQARSSVELSWEQLWAAFFYRGDIYLYVNPDRAFILPQGQADVPQEELWQFLCSCLGDSKCKKV